MKRHLHDEVRHLLSQIAHRDGKLATLPVIEQAKGMLMQDFDCSAEQAFGYLSQLSMDSNTKLVAVAEHVVRTLTGIADATLVHAAHQALGVLRDELMHFRGDTRP